MKVVEPSKGYWCRYCDSNESPMIQLGEEANGPEEWELGEVRVSPEDSNNVEICEYCLEKAIGVLRGNA